VAYLWVDGVASLSKPHFFLLDDTNGLKTVDSTNIGVNMNAEEIKSKVIDIVVEQLEVDVDKVTPTASFTDDLDADSLDVVELVLALEEEFGIDMPDEETEKIKTVQDVIGFIQKAKE